jgi:S-adenosylmethionine:tRNA ribosyltransferase-isomerase
MRISDFDYELPEHLIAQQPLDDRQSSRMLLVDRNAGSLIDENFSHLVRFLRDDDVVVLNNTKVFPARLIGESETGAKVELFLVREAEEMIWETLARPARRLKPGKLVHFGPDLTAEILEKTADGRVRVRFTTTGNFNEILNDVGKTPLPPYIKRGDGPDTDRERYQTVFAKNRGAIAAPTAGLHFTPAILREIKSMGATLCEITLHVGYGTFEPVRVNDLAEHSVMPERYEIDQETAETLNAAKSAGRRIVAIGTTTTRALESSISKHGKFVPENGLADLTITPGYQFKAVDALLTNFHLPQSSLLVLVSTFGGHEFIMNAYKHAVAGEYRFYSYGDCMLII